MSFFETPVNDPAREIEHPLPASRREVIVAFNPRAGASATAEVAHELAEDLQQRDFNVSVWSDIEQIVAAANEQKESLRCVVAAGGDGTVSLLANRLPRHSPIAVLPLGTENLLAKYIQMPTRISDVAEVIEQGAATRLDAGRANGSLFAVMASCGFDAEVVHQVHRARRGHIRHWAYARPIVNSIRNYRYPQVNVWIDNEPDPVRMKWAFVFNAPRYAMGLPIAEGADPMDGQLDLCGFRGGNLWNGLFYLAGVVARSHRRFRDTVFRQVKRLRLESSEPVPYQLDGDPGGHLPLEIEVVPRHLTVVVPRPWLHRQNSVRERSAAAGSQG